MHSINESLRDPAKVLFHMMATQQELETVPCCDGIIFVTLIDVSFPAPSLAATMMGGGGRAGGAAAGGGTGLLTGVSDY